MKVIFLPRFVKDLQAQIDKLFDDDRASWAERLRHEVGDAASMLLRHPEAGLVEPSKPHLRKIILSNIPFIIWYHYDQSAQKVVFQRLFHTRQKR